MSFGFVNIANTLSLARILLAPVYVFLLSGGFRFLSFIVLILGALSDFADGYLARKLKITSKLGEILDPLADKIFSNFVLWGLWFLTDAPYSIFLIALFLTLRDVFLVLGAIYLFTKKMHKVNIKPIFLSKICTFLVFFLCCYATIFGYSDQIFKITSYSVIVFIILTFAIYFKRRKYIESYK